MSTSTNKKNCNKNIFEQISNLHNISKNKLFKIYTIIINIIMLIKRNAQVLFLLHLNSVNSDFMLKNINYVKTTENHLKILTEATKIISKFFKYN